MLKIKTIQILIEVMIVAVVIAILAIATKPEKNFGTSVGFKTQTRQSISLELCQIPLLLVNVITFTRKSKLR